MCVCVCVCACFMHKGDLCAFIGERERTSGKGLMVQEEVEGWIQKRGRMFHKRCRVGTRITTFSDNVTLVGLQKSHIVFISKAYM